MTLPNGAAALARARQSTRAPVGMCLWQVQEWWQSGHAWPTAYSQWQNTIRHSDRNIPIGAPVFYGNGAGHVALYAGNNMIRSTDAPSNGNVGEVPLDWPTRQWGKPFLGWGSKLSGSVLTLPLTTPHGIVYLSKLHYNQMDSDSVRELQTRLNAVRFPPYKSVPVTGNYLTYTDEMVRSWQAFIGDTPDRSGFSSIGPKQAARLWSGTGVSIVP